MPFGPWLGGPTEIWHGQTLLVDVVAAAWSTEPGVCAHEKKKKQNTSSEVLEIVNRYRQ
jgi:poly(3-hydroxybutyrate) depolymerase